MQYSYNVAVLLQGAAFMFNYVSKQSLNRLVPARRMVADTLRESQTEGEQGWKDKVQSLLDSTLRDFFPNNTAYEVACESRYGACSADMLSFKGYVHRWLSVVAQIAPFTTETITAVLRTSAQAAVNQCTGGATGRQCGFYWSSGQFVDPSVDATSGAGEQMNVLAAVSSLLRAEGRAPVTTASGGTSKGNPGGGSSFSTVTEPLRPIGTGDRAGAAIVTFLFLGGALAMFGWMSWDSE